MSTISGVTIQPVLRGITDPDDVVRAEQLDDASTWDTAGMDEDVSPWSARLYLWPGAANPPSWLGFLQEGFGDDVAVPDASRSKAVIVITVRWYGAFRLFVIAFGDGRHQLGIGPDDEPTGSWTLQECLEGQHTVDDGAFLLSAGRYSSVAADFVTAVNQGLTSIGLSTLVLPDSQIVNGEEMSEGNYNILVAGSSADYLLLDKRNVVVSGKTSPIGSATCLPRSVNWST